MPVPEGLHCYCQIEAYPPGKNGKTPVSVTMLLQAMGMACSRLPGYNRFLEVVSEVISEINELERPKDVMSLSGFFDSPRWQNHRDRGIKKKDMVEAFIESSPNGEADLRRMMAYDLIGHRLAAEKKGDMEPFAVLIRGHVEAEIAVSNEFRRKKAKEAFKEEFKNDPIITMLLESGMPVEIINLVR
jgi:hypothetical protein